MSQTNIDYLFQIVAPSADRAPGTSRAGSDASGFNDHLSQAANSVFDVLHAPDFGRARNSQSQLNRDATSADTSQRDSARRDDSRSDYTVCPPPPNSANSSETRGKAPAEVPAKNTKDDADDDAATRDETASAAAGATTVTSSNPESAAKANRADDEHTADQEAAATLKANEAAGAQAKSKVAADAADLAAKLQASGKAVADAKAHGEAGAVQRDEVAETTEAAHAADKLNANSTVTHHEAKEKLTSAAQTSTANMELPATPTGAEGVKAAPAAATMQANLETAANANDAPPEKSDDSSDDAGVDAKSSNRSEAGAPNVKPEPTAIANNVAASAAIAAGENESSKDASEGSTKPVSAKQETAVGPLGRALKNATNMTRGAQSAGESEMAHVDPARFVSRVSKAFQTANERGGELQLRLSPPELGSLKLQLTVKDGVMSAQLETETATARRLLLEHLPALRDRLAEQNIRVERFDVDVRQENNGGQANPRGSNQNPHQPQPEQNGNQRPGSPRLRSEEPATQEPIIISQRVSSSGINLVI